MNRRGFLLTPTLLLAQSSFDNAILGANTAISGYSLEQAIRTVKGLEFDTIEIQPMGEPQPRPGLFPGFQFDRISAAQRKAIRDWLKGFRNITTHLPYHDLHFFSEYSNVRDFSVRQVEIAMEASAYYGAKLAVVHVTALPSTKTMDQAWPEILDRFRQWGDRARKLGFRLAIETGLPRSVRDYVRLIREIDHPSVGCTLDVGHQIQYEEFAAKVKPANRSTPEGFRVYNDVMHALVDQLGPKIFHFHVHDIDPSTWVEHKPIGFDVIDYARLLRKLRQVNYPGLLVLEIGAPDMPRALADSRDRLRRYLKET